MSTLVAQPTSRSEQVGQCTTLFETALGWMALEFDATHLRGVHFGYPSFANLVSTRCVRDREIVDSVPPWVGSVCDRLRRFAEGQPQDLGSVPVATEHLTPFASNVVRACRKLEWGQIATYAQLAATAGRPGAARAVGNVMATNRFPLVVPCHRVVGSGGSLGGYSAPGGLATKRRLLETEGVL